MIRDASALNDLLERTRRFVREVAIPNEDRTEREDKVPDEAVAAMRALGAFGWSIPEAYGGSGLTTEELALAFLELSQASVAYRVVGATNAGIGSECLIRDGTDDQKARYLPRLASGELLGCLALTESEAGSDATALKTAVRLAEAAPTAIRWTKYALNNWLRSAGPTFDTSLALEFLAFTGPDVKEGIASIREKRTPKFSANSPV